MAKIVQISYGKIVVNEEAAKEIIGYRGITQFQPAAGGGVSGSGTPTNAADTSSGAGTVGHKGTGTPANAADTATSSGKIGHTGSGTPTNAADTSAASGKIGHVGTVNVTEGADTSAGTGEVGSTGVTGSGAPVEAPDTSAGAGTIGHVSSGAPVEGADIASGSGTVGHVGSGAATEGADTSSGSGTVGEQAPDVDPYEAQGWPTRNFYAPYWMGTVPQHEIDEAAQHHARRERIRLGIIVPEKADETITKVARKQAKRRPAPPELQAEELKRTIEKQQIAWDDRFARELDALRNEFRQVEDARREVKTIKRQADEKRRAQLKAAADRELDRRRRQAEQERIRHRNQRIAAAALMLTAV